MAKEITVNTRLGNGGQWVIVARYTSGPRNPLKAENELNAERNKNRGVGGYLSNLKVDGLIIGAENLEWDLGQAAAARIIADPEGYAPYQHA